MRLGLFIIIARLEREREKSAEPFTHETRDGCVMSVKRTGERGGLGVVGAEGRVGRGRNWKGLE